jgi:hypothetical protein
MVALTFAQGAADVAVRLASDGRRWRTVLDSHAGSAPDVLDGTEAGAETIELMRPARSVLVLRDDT